MKNLFNNISQEEKNRILEMHSGKKRVISENINFINEGPGGSALANEFRLMATSGERALKTEIERLLVTTELKTTSGIALKTADEVLNAFLAGKLTTNDVKVVTKDIINNSKNLDLKLNYINKLVSSKKYEELMAGLSRVEAVEELTKLGYLHPEEIIHAYEKIPGNTFQKYSSAEKESLYKKEVNAGISTAQLVKEIDELENFISDFKNLTGLDVAKAPGMPARVQKAKKILEKIKNNPASIPPLSKTQLESIENSIRTSEPSLWNYIQKYNGKLKSQSKASKTIAIITICFAIGGAFWGQVTKFFAIFLKDKFTGFIDDFKTGYSTTSSSSKTTTTPKNLANYDITVGDDMKPIYTPKK
jgi:hypothetical protein